MKWCSQDPQRVYSFTAVDLNIELNYSFGFCSARKLSVNCSELSHQDGCESGEYDVVRHVERSRLIQS